MKKARIILTTWILLAGLGVVLALNVNRFTASPVQITTDYLTTRVNGMICTVIAGFGGAPAELCTSDPIAFWSSQGVLINAWSTNSSLRTVNYNCPDGSNYKDYFKLPDC